MAIVSKICSSCKEPLNPSEFYDHPDAKDGKQKKCKACTLRDQKAYKVKPKQTASNSNELEIINKLKSLNIYAAPGKCSEWKWCDVVAWGCVKLEVKTANQSEKGAFIFSTSRNQQKNGFTADFVILVCNWKHETTYHVFPANHSSFFMNGRMKRGFKYDPYSTGHKNGRGVRLSSALMNQYKDKWEGIEQKRLSYFVIKEDELIISNPEQMTMDLIA